MALGGIKIRKKILVIFILMLFSAIGLIQCATKTHLVREAEEEILKTRVREYWAHRIKGEWDKSYLFESPEYREKVSLLNYINQHGRSLVKWVDFEITEIAVKNGEGKVKVSGKYMYLIPQVKKAEFQRLTEELWGKVETQWFRLSQPLKGAGL
jgi:hypothetical protein